MDHQTVLELQWMKREMDHLWTSVQSGRPGKCGEEAWELLPSSESHISVCGDGFGAGDWAIPCLGQKKKRLVSNLPGKPNTVSTKDFPGTL